MCAGNPVVAGTPRGVVNSLRGKRKSNSELEIHTYIIIESKSHPINQTDPKNRIKKSRKGKRKNSVAKERQ